MYLKIKWNASTKKYPFISFIGLISLYRSKSKDFFQAKITIIINISPREKYFIHSKIQTHYTHHKQTLHVIKIIPILYLKIGTQTVNSNKASKLKIGRSLLFCKILNDFVRMYFVMHCWLALLYSIKYKNSHKNVHAPVTFAWPNRMSNTQVKQVTRQARRAAQWFLFFKKGLLLLLPYPLHKLI